MPHSSVYKSVESNLETGRYFHPTYSYSKLHNLMLEAKEILHTTLKLNK